MYVYVCMPAQIPAAENPWLVGQHAQIRHSGYRSKMRCIIDACGLQAGLDSTSHKGRAGRHVGGLCHALWLTGVRAIA